jgi:hypothetical protein
MNRCNTITTNTPILITSAIIQSAPLTKLTDKHQRLGLLVDSILLWAESGAQVIVVCDGSTANIAHELSTLLDISRLQCKIEVIGFINSLPEISKLGKGYGEGEIVKYALKHSKALSESDHFIKCTGKLFVTNYLDVIASFRGDFGAYFGESVFWPKYVDTRFYISSIEFFNQYMINAYKSVNDPNWIYLENVYFSVLSNIGSSNWILRVPPKYVGVSGSSGHACTIDKQYAWRLFFSNIYYFVSVLRLFFSKIYYFVSVLRSCGKRFLNFLVTKFGLAATRP